MPAELNKGIVFRNVVGIISNNVRLPSRFKSEVHPVAASLFQGDDLIWFLLFPVFVKFTDLS
jgi:hypothetical protein